MNKPNTLIPVKGNAYLAEHAANVGQSKGLSRFVHAKAGMITLSRSSLYNLKPTPFSQKQPDWCIATLIIPTPESSILQAGIPSMPVWPQSLFASQPQTPTPNPQLIHMQHPNSDKRIVLSAPFPTESELPPQLMRCLPHHVLFICRADADGRLTGPDAVKFFERSGLPRDQLAKVWALADNARRGYLDTHTFAHVSTCSRRCAPSLSLCISVQIALSPAHFVFALQLIRSCDSDASFT